MKIQERDAAAFETAHLEAIEDNPIDITINLEGRVRKGGGFEELKGPLVKVRARLYQEATGRSGAQEQTSVAGITQTDARWGLLLPTKGLTPEGGEISIALSVDPQTTLWFEHPVLGRFKLTEIYPNQDAGKVWGWRAIVERTK